MSINVYQFVDNFQQHLSKYRYVEKQKKLTMKKHTQRKHQ